MLVAVRPGAVFAYTAVWIIAGGDIARRTLRDAWSHFGRAQAASVVSLLAVPLIAFARLPVLVATAGAIAAAVVLVRTEPTDGDDEHERAG